MSASSFTICMETTIVTERPVFATELLSIKTFTVCMSANGQPMEVTFILLILLIEVLCIE